MISAEALREMFEYNYWARDRQLRACAGLTHQQFLRHMGSSFSSLRDTLWHLLVTESVWLGHWRRRTPSTTVGAEAYYKEVAGMLAPEKLSTVASIREHWGTVERDMRDYLAGLREEALARTLTYINAKGETWTYPLWRTLFGIVDHQTYHRGRVTTLLRQLGAQPPQVRVYYGAVFEARNEIP